MVEECLGAAARGEPIRLTIRGSFREVPFAVRLGAGHLADLLTARPELPLDLELDLGTAHMEIALQLAELDEAALDAAPDAATGDSVRAAQARGSYRLVFSVDRLDRLNRPLSLALPPLGPVDVRAQAKIGRDEWNLHTLRLGVGDTRLVGHASIAKGAARPLASFELTSRSFRIDDFVAEGWSFAGGAEAEPEAETSQEVPAATTGGEEPRALLDPRDDAAPRRAPPREGGRGGEWRRVPRRWRAARPAGRRALRARPPPAHRRPRRHRSVAHLVAGRWTRGARSQRIAFETEHFDLGVLAPSHPPRPTPTMGGILDVDMAVEVDAPDPTNLMAYADGKFDVFFQPVNLEAGLIDLWAVNPGRLGAPRRIGRGLQRELRGGAPRPRGRDHDPRSRS